jgi:recombination protein RecT
MPKEKGKEIVVMDSSEVIGFVETTNEMVAYLQKQCNDKLFNLLGNEMLVKRFVSSIILCFARNPKLNDCTKESLRNVCLACAEFRLFPSSITGQCYIVPFKNKKKGVTEATFMLGYQGMITLAERAGCQMIDAQVVYEKDVFKCTRGTNPSITHEADVFSEDRGKPVGVYAVAVLKSGYFRVFPMSTKDVAKHRAKSKTDTFWDEKNDLQLTMPKKTAIRQLFKFIPKDDPVIQKALEMDAEGEYGSREIVINGTPLIEHDKMSQEDIKGWYARLLDTYNTDDINNALLKVRKGKDTFDGMSWTEANAITERLRGKEIDQAAPTDGESQGTMLDD